MAKRVGGSTYKKPYPKKTRQGMGKNTKYGNSGGGPRGGKPSKNYKKKYRGQGRWKYSML